MNMKDKIQIHESDTNQYRLISIVTGLLIILTSCLKPILAWEIAEPFGLGHQLLFFAQWVSLLGVFISIGRFWRAHTLEWKNVSRFLFIMVVLYVFCQILTYGIDFLLFREIYKFSLIDAEETIGYLTSVIVGVLFLWGVSKLNQTWLRIILFFVLILMGIASGLHLDIGNHPFVYRFVLGSPILLLSYDSSLPRITNRKKRIVFGVLGVLPLVLILVLFERLGLHNYVGLVAEAQISYQMMYLTNLQGILGRCVWYVVSIFFTMGFLLLVPKRRLFFLTDAGEHATGIYVVAGVISMIFSGFHLDDYKDLCARYGYWVAILTAIFLSVLTANPYATRLYAMISKRCRKWRDHHFPLNQLELHIGEKMEYSRKERITLIVIVSFFFAFTFLILGPYEMFLSSSQYLVANFSDVWFPMLIAGVLGFLVILLTFALIKGRIGDILISLIFGITFTGYIQGNFMNIDLGDLSGTTIVWKEYYVEAIRNSIIWVLILLGIIGLYHFSKKMWKGFLTKVSVYLILVQLVAFVSLFFSLDISDKNAGYFSNAKEFEMASDENVVVFVLDMMDTDYIKEILEQTPDFLDEFDGFTYYPNCVSRFQRTFPSVAYMLTEEPFRFDMETPKYFEEAWKRSPQLHKMKEDDYRIQVFGNMKYTAGSGEAMEGLVDNYSTDRRKVPYVRFPLIMLKLVAYRDMPHVLKQFFWLYTEDINDVYQDGYRVNDYAFYRTLVQGGLTKGDCKKQFIFYHLNGSHGPLLLDADANKVKSGTDTISQTEGCLKIVLEYMRQMKEIGVYDNSTIIITADHGDALATDLSKDTLNPVFMMKQKGNTGKCGISQKPVMNSDIMSTVCGENIVSDEVSNISLLTEDSERVRTIYSVWGSTAEIYEIRGDAQEYSNWKQVDTTTVKYDIYN